MLFFSCPIVLVWGMYFLSTAQISLVGLATIFLQPYQPTQKSTGLLPRAKDGSRTRNLQLGRLELYQLSYFR